MAAGPEALPDPLSLDQALAIAERGHPVLEHAEAVVDLARAGRRAAAARTGLRAYVEISSRKADIAASPGSTLVDDSRARLVLTKLLHDFGRAHALESAAAHAVSARRWRLAEIRARRRVEVTRRFFEVLLADLRYAVDEQRMAYRYVRFDHARLQHRLGMISAVDLAALESRYREALLRRAQSEKAQTETRARLAAALNRPDSLPGELLRPRLAAETRPVPEYEAVFAEVFEASPLLHALHAEVEAARSAVAAARALRRPALAARLEAAEYARALGARSELLAALELHIPIYQGGESAAALAEAAARLREREAAYEAARQALQVRVLELVQRLEYLAAAREAAAVRLDARDRALDRARARYELEIQATLGDVMTRLSEAELERERVAFAFALAWAELDALAGRSPALTSGEKGP